MIVLLFRYLFSEEKEAYQQIARKYGTSAWNVYKIDNGKVIRSLKEGCVQRELFRRKFIS